MKINIIFLIFLLTSCSTQEKKKEIEAKLKYKLVFDKEKSYRKLKVIYLTTIIKNNTDKDVYLYQLGSSYLLPNNAESKGEYIKIDTLKFDWSFFERNNPKFVTMETYVQMCIKNDKDKSTALEEFLKLNKDCIQKRDETNFANHFIFLKKGEELEINNYPINLYDTDSDKIKYNIFFRKNNIIDEYKKDKVCYNFPEKVGIFELYNNKIESDTLSIDYEIVK